MVVLQTIETQYNNVNQLASSLRKAGAIIKVSKIKSDIFSISVNQLPRLLTIEEIATGVVNAEDTEKVSEVAVDETTSEQVKTAQKKVKSAKSKKQSNQQNADTKIDVDNIPF